MNLQGYPGCCGIQCIVSFPYDEPKYFDAGAVEKRLYEITSKTTLPIILAAINSQQLMNIDHLLGAGFVKVTKGEFNYSRNVDLFVWVNPSNKKRSEDPKLKAQSYKDRTSGVKW